MLRATNEPCRTAATAVVADSVPPCARHPGPTPCQMVASPGSPPAGFRIERSSGAGGNVRRLSFSGMMRICDHAALLATRELDVGDIVAVLIVAIGSVAFVGVDL